MDPIGSIGYFASQIVMTAKLAAQAEKAKEQNQNEKKQSSKDTSNHQKK